jgi:hypothetical protein
MGIIALTLTLEPAGRTRAAVKLNSFLLFIFRHTHPSHMNFSKSMRVLAFGLVATLVVPLAAQAKAGDPGWGWAKPLNKRMGAFYTSNRNANFGRSTSKSYHRRPVYRAYPTYRVPTGTPSYRYSTGHRYSTSPRRIVPTPRYRSSLKPNYIIPGQRFGAPSSKFIGPRH